MATADSRAAPLPPPAGSGESGSYRLVVIEGGETPGASLEQRLGAHLDPWRALLGRALEPNVFYRPELLVANLTHFPPPEGFRLLLVYYEAPGERRLVGLFPLAAVSSGPAGLVRQHQLFASHYMNLRTPLVDRDHAPASLDCLLDWLDRQATGRSLLGFKMITLDGPFWSLLRARLEARAQPSFLRERHARAFLRRAESAEAYLRAALSAKRRKEYKRLHNRLGELGRLELVACTATPDVPAWIERFLALEASGWKGQAGTALAVRDAAFSRQLLLAMHAEGLLLLHALLLDDRVIAQRCGFRDAPADGGGYSFKIAYDERYARFSPGVLLELELVRLLHEGKDQPEWMDSCAIAGHPMIDRIWSQRREIGYLLCGARNWRNRLLFALPLALVAGRPMAPMSEARHER